MRMSSAHHLLWRVNEMEPRVTIRKLPLLLAYLAFAYGRSIQVLLFPFTGLIYSINP